MLFMSERDTLATRQTLFLRLNAETPGREIAWRDFYGRYAPIISGFARKIGVDSHDVPDIIQDVMLGFFAVSPRFVYDPARGRFRGYLKTCVWRACQAHVGTRLRFDGRPIEQIDPAEPNIEATWNEVWDTEKLQRALEVVRTRYLARSDKARTFRAFEMYALLDSSAEDVAKELGISVASVHQAKTRVTKAIKAAADEIDSTNG